MEEVGGGGEKQQQWVEEEQDVLMRRQLKGYARQLPFRTSNMARHSTFNEVQVAEVCALQSCAANLLTVRQVGNLPLLPVKCGSRTSPAGVWTGGEEADPVDEAISVFRANVFYRWPQLAARMRRGV